MDEVLAICAEHGWDAKLGRLAGADLSHAATAELLIALTDAEMTVRGHRVPHGRHHQSDRLKHDAAPLPEKVAAARAVLDLLR